MNFQIIKILLLLFLVSGCVTKPEIITTIPEHQCLVPFKPELIKIEDSDTYSEKYDKLLEWMSRNKTYVRNLNDYVTCLEKHIEQFSNSPQS